MKKFFGLIAVLLISGCTSVPPEALSQAADNALISDAYVALMEKGETQPAQDKAFILANRRSWHAQNFALNEAPLPEDLQPGADAGSINLLEILENDPRVRAKINELREALQPEQPDGN
jgi:hypothetical protein